MGAEAAAWRTFTGSGSFMGLVVVAGVLAGVGVVAVVRGHGSSALLSVGLVAGLVCGGVYWASWIDTVRETDRDPPSRWVGEVVGDPARSMFGERSLVEVSRGRHRYRVRVGWPRGTDAPPAGAVCVIFGGYRAPGTDAWGRRAMRAGQIGSISARRFERTGRARSLRGVIEPWRTKWSSYLDPVGGEGGALLAGVVLGDRTRLAGTEAESAFRTTGLTHLVAVSGGHLVVVAALAAWLFTRLRTRKVVAVTCVLAVTGAYVVVSGVQASALRAWLMSAVIAASSLGHRRGDGIAALSAALWICLVLTPAAAFDLGMQLSVVSVLALLLFARLAETWVRAAMPPGVDALAGPVAMTLVAQAATVPLTSATFGMVSLVAPIANLLVGPLVSAVLVVGLAGLALHMAVPAAGGAALRAAATVGGIAARISEWLAGWPHAAIPLGGSVLAGSLVAAMAACVLWVWWPKASPRGARLLALSCIVAVAGLAVGPSPPKGAQIIVLDVGQGDAILVRDGGHAVLVDAGPDEQALRGALLRHGVRGLDCVVVTHLHDDHYGGIEALKGVVPVARIVVPAGALEQAPKTCAEFRSIARRVEEVRAGGEVCAGRLRLTAVSPPDAATDVTTNEASVVVVARLGAFDALLTGDAEAPVLRECIASGRVGDVELIKVGHHGSADAVDEGVLRVLRPEYALVSVGARNRFGHPVASTLDALSAARSRVLRTDVAGDITVRTDGTRFSVACDRRR